MTSTKNLRYKMTTTYDKKMCYFCYSDKNPNGDGCSNPDCKKYKEYKKEE